jgi:Family of unknown function (DUF5682)
VPVKVFGIRHHGPGSARSLLSALEAMRPDAVLVEGPPDAEDELPLLARPEMQPPVALLVYPPDAPQHAAYYPFAEFSPEWQALRYALGHGVMARFMDLPRSLDLEGEDEESEVREDPIGLLAEAAGYEDRELWWEQQVEQRRDAADLFDAILEAMAALREYYDPPPREARREAYMRRVIRKILREGHENIAVVCGAWHAPALLPEEHAVKSDDALLKGLKKRKTSATWIPWTAGRLSYRSGYGAGIASPGYYEHLWSSSNGSITIRWLSNVARLLRAEDLDASPANIVEAARVADTLAAIRDLPAPGLDELREAVLATLCGGEEERLALIRGKLEIGEKLGEVPTETPTVPLQHDLQRLQKRLRLKPSAVERHLDLDLREENGRARSELLHRLRLLGVEWGEPRAVSGKSGTFHELWMLRWRPELSVALIEANVWGNTVETASSFRVRHLAEDADLPRLTSLLDAAILARLPEDSVGYLLGRVRDCAASADAQRLMDALPPLVRVVRYGDVRGTEAASVLPVVDTLFERAIVALPGACSSLDDDAAREMAGSISGVEDCVDLLDRPGMAGRWRAVLRPLAENEGVHALVRGWCCRLLLETRVLNEDELQRLAGLSLSPAVPAPEAAAWVEGVLRRGSGLILLHQTGLWKALDGWLTGLDPETFITLLPLVRRAFSDFEPAEKRAMGEKVRKLGSGGESSPERGGNGTGDLDHQRAARTLPVLAQVLGVDNYG